MALYAIGDTHLSLGSDKPMDVFGGGWEGYVEKLSEGFAQVEPEDTVVLCGDISWGMSLEEAEADFAFLDGLRQQHFKFYIRCFIGAAKGGHQHFVLGLVRVLDVVQRLFQR